MYRRIDGIELDGTCVTMTIGAYRFDILKCSYGDNLTPEKLKQMGSQRIDALTPGQYETEEAKLSMSMSVYRGELAPLLAANGWGNTPLSIIFSFTHPTIGNDSDMLFGRLIGVTSSLESSSKALEVELKMITTQILWTDRRISINNRGDIYSPFGFTRLA